MILTVAASIFVFGLLVLVHEFGHFITAKMTGMRVDEFAIGFGPKLISTKKGETVYSIRAVPLGGFNDIAGMDPLNNDAGSRGYCEKPVLSRMIVILAGSAMNFVLPIVLFFGIFFFSGVTTPSTEPVIGTVIEGKAADIAGIKTGDRVISVNGNEVATWVEFVETIRNDTEGLPLNVVYEREGQINEASLQPTYEKDSKRFMIGVQVNTTVREVGFVESMQLALQRTVDIVEMMLGALVEIFQSPTEADLAGPIGIAQMAGRVAETGFIPLLNFAALLSLNLGIINLLPVPALDGGYFVTLALEAVRGKPLGPKALIYAQRVGVVLLLILMLFATKNDIVRVFFS